MPYGVPKSGAGNGEFNAVVNGDASIFQRVVSSGSSNNLQNVNVTAGIGTFPTTSGSNALITGPDQWFLNWTNPGGGYSITYGRRNNSPTVGGLGYTLSSVAAGGGVNTGATALLTLNTPMEGMNFTHLMYGPATLSFDVFSPATGNHYVTLYAGGNGMPGGGPAFVMQFRVLIANSWQHVVIPLDLRAGSGFLTNSAATLGVGRAFTLHFPLVVGSNHHTANFGNWIATGTNAMAGADAPNLAANLSPFDVTNIAILPGSMNTFPNTNTQEMLARCKRYFWCSRFGQGGSWAEAPLEYYCRVAGIFNESIILPYPVPMAIVPTISCVNFSGGVDKTTWRNTTASTDSGAFTTLSATPNYATIVNPQVVGDAQGDRMQAAFIVNGRI